MPCINPACMQNYRPVAAPISPPLDRRLAKAHFVPQPFIGILPLDEALNKGTIFPNMAMPYPEEYEV